MLKILELLVSFAYEAVKVYAASEQGSVELVQILDAVEAEGIDVPFYEPSSQDGGNGDTEDNGTQDQSAQSFQARHPELYK